MNHSLIKTSQATKVLALIVLWRLLLYLVQHIGINTLSLNQDFLGGGMNLYLQNPYLWAWGNFDGVHYLSIALNGYKSLQYFFFPLYPGVVSIFSNSIVSSVIVGQLISTVFLVMAGIGLMRLSKLDKLDGKLVLCILLLFPTAFYFAGVYTESLFLFLVVWSFYSARKKNWLAAGILGGLAASTRVIGIVLFPALFVEMIDIGELKASVIANVKNLQYLLLVPLGLLAYMYYLYLNTGDPIEFVNSVEIFGDQRSSTFILLPQVFYRYIFKILPNLNYNYFTGTFPILLEFLVSSFFLGLAALSFKYQRLSYAIYLSLAYLIPTLSGSFSSMSRYVLILFPAFFLIAKSLEKRRTLKVIYFTISTLLLFVSVILFTRGYWVA